ncbi:MAG: hypothetical protein GC202_11530 [Alphaproteobacteria bacterium]|nr:hypothetical protein [Alphaproteobacteria bacterium]
MIVLRIFAWLFFAGAAAAAGLDGFGWLESGEYVPIPLGQVWASVNRESLLLLEPALVRHVHPVLWTDVVFPILLTPAWIVAGVAGIALWFVARPRVPRRRRRPDWR